MKLPAAATTPTRTPIADQALSRCLVKVISPSHYFMLSLQRSGATDWPPPFRAIRDRSPAKTSHVAAKRPYPANLCRFLRSARNDARWLPIALLSHTGGPNARAPGWAAVDALRGHSRTEVSQFRTKKE